MQCLKPLLAAAAGSALVLALGYMATVRSVHGQLETAASVISNRALKQDRLDAARHPASPPEPVQGRIPDFGRTAEAAHGGRIASQSEADRMHAAPNLAVSAVPP
jgi:hypothetical protein